MSFFSNLLPSSSSSESSPYNSRITKILTIQIIDNSGSMNEDASKLVEALGFTRCDFARQGALLCINAYPEDQYMGVIQYSNNAQLLTPIDSLLMTPANKAKACSSIMTIRPSGGTEIFNGLQLAKQVAMNAIEIYGITDVHFILMTDGEDNTLKKHNIDQYFKQLFPQGPGGRCIFTMDTIGFGADANTELLVGWSNKMAGLYSLCFDASVVGPIFGRAIARAYLDNEVYGIYEPTPSSPNPVYHDYKRAYNHFKTNLKEMLLNPNFRTLKDRANAVDILNKEIEDWFTANPNPQKTDPDWFGLICGIHEELNDQLRKSANNANYWAEWGKAHWQTVGIALDRECSTNNKTACIQHFGTPRAIAEYARIAQIYGEMQMIKPSRLEEKLAEARRRTTEYVPPPRIYTNTQQFDEEVQRGGGCFHHTSTLRTPDGSQIGYNEIVSIIESGRVVKVLSDVHGIVPIEAIVKTPMNSKTQFVQVGNTVLTPTHPILDENTNRWFHPKALAAIYEEDVPFVFNVILGVNPDTGMRYGSVNIDGHECVGLGHGINHDPVATDSFWGTEAIVDRMKELYADQYYDYQRRTSLITFTHTLKRNSVTGWVDKIV